MAKGEVLARWLKLLMAIQGGRPYTARQLAERMQVSARTIFRDLSGMQSAGVPLYYDDQARTYRLTENFNIPALTFDGDELIALVSALSFVRRAGPMRSRRTAEALVDKLMAALPLRQREAAGDLDRALVIDPLQSRSIEDDQIVQALERAVAGRRSIVIRYAALSHAGEESERTVQPYGLAHRGTSLYLIGYCLMRRDIRTFRVSRIRMLRPDGQTFTVPGDFDLNHFLLQVWGITDGPEVEVRLLFAPTVASLARETRWHYTQQVAMLPDGSALVTMRTRGITELARWISGYGGHVTVQAPPELWEAVVRLAEGVLQGHSTASPEASFTPR